MKVLQINAVYGVGSTGKIARDISDKLIELGHKSYIMWAIECKNPSSKADFIRIGSSTDHKLHALLRRLDGGQGLHSKAATKKACKKILDISPDVVHLHNLHSNYIHLPTLLEFLSKHNIPTLITMHDCWLVSGYCSHYINYNCQKWLSECTDCPAVPKRLKKKVNRVFLERQSLYENIKHLAVNGVSMWTTDAAKQSILKNASHIECIYNFIDINLYKPKDNVSEIKKKHGIPADRKLILGVSQLWSSQKGLDAFVMLADKLSDSAEIILVGADNGIPHRPNLKCIGFTSNVDELICLYSAADVLVNASNAETFGLVTVEAMACGTPVVAFNNTGSAELVNNQCGRLIPNGDLNALLNGVVEILNNGKDTYSAACRDYVCKNFEKNDQLQKYIDFYEKLSSK